MKKNERIFLSILSILVWAIILSGCASDGVLIAVKNKTKTPISNIIISGYEFSTKISGLNPGEKYSFIAYPKGESSVAIQFEANDQIYDIALDTYFESGGLYRVKINIESDFTATVHTRLALFSYTLKTLFSRAD